MAIKWILLSFQDQIKTVFFNIEKKEYICHGMIEKKRHQKSKIKQKTFSA